MNCFHIRVYRFPESFSPLWHRVDAFELGQHDVSCYTISPNYPSNNIRVSLAVDPWDTASAVSRYGRRHGKVSVGSAPGWKSPHPRHMSLWCFTDVQSERRTPGNVI